MVDSLLQWFDIYYTEPAATQMGFMLAKTTKGTKAWERFCTSPLPDNYPSGDISYANLSPDVQKVISQRYMYGGLGALEFEVEDDAAYQMLRYLKSLNIDCRCKGKAYPGPKIIGLDVPGWVTPTGHVDEAAGWTNETYAYDDNITGTYASAAAVAAGTYSGWLDFTIASSTISGVRVYANISGDTANIKVEVYYGAAWHEIFADAALPRPAAWNYFGMPDAQAITACRIAMKNNGAVARNCFIYEVDFFSESGTSVDTPVESVNFNDKLYFAQGKILMKLGTAGANLCLASGFDYDITHIETWGDYLLIALAKANFYYYMNTSEACTLSNLADGKADRFCNVGTSLWRLQLPNDLRVSTNPLNGGSWAAAVTCGEAAYNVNDMKEYNELLWCLKEDGPYYYDSTDTAFYAPFPELASIAHADAGKNSTVFRGGLYFRMGNQQEWEIKDGVLTEVTPSLFSQGIAAYAYPCVARAHDESWLYAIIKRGAGDLAVLAGRWEYISGRTRWIWHEIRSIDLTDVSSAYVSSVEGRPYLYLASTVATENVYKIYLPVTNDATADADYRFYTAGSLWSPRYMTLLYAIDKRWQELFVRSVNLSATNYINVYYSVNDGSTFPTLLAKFITSPEQTGTLTAIESTMLNLRFDFVGDSETVPPVLKYHNLKALTLMNSVSKFVHTIKAADRLKLKSNIQSTITLTEIITFIDLMRDSICTLGDRDGVEHTVMVRVVHEIETFDDERGLPERQYTIEATEV